MRFFITPIIVLTVLSTSSCAKGLQGQMPPVAGKGVLDLTGWDFSRGDILKLDGEWEFYPEHFIDPGKDTAVPKDERPGFITLPSSWQGMAAGGRTLPSEGYASFRLKILLPENAPPLSIQFRNIHTAFTAYINGSPVCRRGTVGKSAEQSRADTIYSIADLLRTDSSLDLVIHVSNFYHKDAGLIRSLYLGNESDIHRSNEFDISLSLFLFGSIMIIGLYYLILFILHREDKSFLYFCLLCILTSARIFVVGDTDMTDTIFSMSWDVLYRTAILSFAVAPTVFCLYLFRLYPKESFKPFLYVMIIASSVFSLIVLLTPTITTSRIVPAYDIFVLACAVYIIAIIIMSVVRKREGSLIFFTGFIILLLSVINDILHDNMVIQTGFMSPFGLFIFIVFQILLLSQRYDRSITSLKKMTGEFRENNDHLLKVLIDLKQKQDVLLQQEKKAVVGSLASGLAHEIKNQLHSLSVLEFLNDRFSPEDREYIGYILESRDRISSMVDEIRALGKEEESSYAIKPVALSLILKETLVLAKIDPEVKNRHLMIAEHFEGDVLADKNKLIQVILNLVRNAAHAIAGNERGLITIRTDREAAMALVKITDNGTGIAPEALEKIFEAFYTTKGESGTGLGLHICRRIIEGHGGSIRCDSRQGEGSTFTFTIPLAGMEGDA